MSQAVVLGQRVGDMQSVTFNWLVRAGTAKIGHGVVIITYTISVIRDVARLSSVR